MDTSFRLKHAAPHTKTISLDNTYQPNATWSFANISLKDWQESLEAISAVPERGDRQMFEGIPVDVGLVHVGERIGNEYCTFSDFSRRKNSNW